MKRLIFAIIFLNTIFFSVYADEAWVKFGYIPNRGYNQVVPSKGYTDTRFNNILSVDLGFKKELFNKILFIQGDTNIYASMPAINSIIGGFFPFFSSFNIKGGFQYKGFTLYVEHQCSHPVDCYDYKGLAQFPVFNVNDWYNMINFEYRIKI